MDLKSIPVSKTFGAIDGIEKLNPNSGIGETANPGAPAKTSFTDFLVDKLGEVNKLGLDADKGIQSALLGQETNPHATMIAMQKADISFRLLMSVKQRLEQAYQQLIRMPIG